MLWFRVAARAFSSVHVGPQKQLTRERDQAASGPADYVCVVWCGEVWCGVILIFYVALCGAMGSKMMSCIYNQSKKYIFY